MCLVGKAGFESDVYKRCVRIDDAFLNLVDPYPPNVLARRAILKLPEYASQMRRMNTGRIRKLGKAGRFLIILVQVVFYSAEPDRRLAFISNEVFT